MKHRNWLVPTLYILFLMLPIYWLLNMSFKTTNEILGGFSWFPADFTVASYVKILTDPTWYNGYINSIIYVVLNTVISVAFALPAAYAFSRYRFLGDKHLFFWLLTNRMAPPAVFALPFLQLYSALGLFDTHIAVALSHCLFNIPLAVWILEGFISGVRGGGLVNGAGFAFPKTTAKLQHPELVPEGTRTLNIVDIGRHLLDASLQPPIAALFIYNHNPVIVHPDQNKLRRGLEREDLFVVGCDVQMTDSLAYADVVLPAATHFEYADLYPAYGTHWLQRAEPVIAPLGESLPNTEIFRRLAARFGFDDPMFQADDHQLMDDACDAADPRMQGLRPSRIPLDQALPMTYAGQEAVLYQNVHPATETGKVELESGYLARRYGAPLPTFRPVENGYPLALISPASDRRISSTFGGLRFSDETPTLDMHPEDATARNLTDGARVRVWNDLGEVFLPLRITDEVRPGVVCSLKGAWFRTSDNGQTISALCPAHHADISEGACYNDARVEVAAA